MATTAWDVPSLMRKFSSYTVARTADSISILALAVQA